jgi:hypothetical protein
LIRTEGCSLPTQRSDGAVPAHVFQNSLPTHSVPPFSFASRLCTGRFSKSLAGMAERADGLRTVDLRRSIGLSGLPWPSKGETARAMWVNSILQESGRYNVVKRKTAVRSSTLRRGRLYQRSQNK